MVFVGIEILVRPQWELAGSVCEIPVSSVQLSWTGPQLAESMFLCNPFPQIRSRKLLRPNGICTPLGPLIRTIRISYERGTPVEGERFLMSEVPL